MLNKNKKKYVCQLFKESYDILGIDIEGGDDE